MRKISLLTLAILALTYLPAQKTFKKNTLYGEIAGNGLVLSANYERMLGNKPGLALHVGVGLGGDKPVIPLGAKYLFDLGNQKSFLETGVGMAISEYDFIDNKTIVSPNGGRYIVGFIPSVGYRHHTPYGLMWRVNYTPVFFSVRTMALFGGISLGWRL
jgi:hypothetical protein